MNKKLIKFFLLLIIFLFALITNVNAWYTPSNNKTALAVGASYSDGISSTGNADDAYTTYNSMGLSTTKLLTPSANSLRGNHSNGTPLLQSGIVYLNGHANSNLIEFPNNVLITSNSSINGSSIGIGAYDNTKTALIEFAGCQTARGTENITRYANDQGANITIGWTTDLNVSSFVNWNKRFNDEIAKKTVSVNSAAQSASNHIYLNNNVKNYKIYGSGNYNPWYWITGSTSATLVNTSLKTNEYVILNNTKMKEINNLNKDIIKKLAEKYIIENINSDFDSSNYVVEVNGNDTIYIDYVYYIDDIRTNLGYTLSITNDGNFYLFDNMNGKNDTKIKQKETTIIEKYRNLDCKSTENKALASAKKIGNKVNIKNQTKYYDFENDKSYYVYEILVTTESGACSLRSYQYEI